MLYSKESDLVASFESEKRVTTKLDKLMIGCWVQIAVVIIALSEKNDGLLFQDITNYD